MSVRYLALRLAADSGWAVASIDYRLAPEHPFPAGLEDVLEATQWLVGHAGRLGLRRDRVVLAGDSAGGNLVTAALQLAKEREMSVLLEQIGLQLLIYPWLELSCLTCYASQLDNGAWGTVTLHSIARMIQYYAGNERAASHSLISPVLATTAQLQGLPPAVVFTAELDPLRDEGEAYAAKLAAAGVPTTLTRYNGTVHGFIFFHTSAHFEGIADIVRHLEHFATQWGWS